MARREPTDERELAAWLEEASRADVPVAITGGGRRPEPDALSEDGVDVLALAAPAFRGTLSLEPDEGRVTVRAGTRLADLVSELAAAGQWLPGATAGFGGSAGGLVGRAAPGPFDTAYGTVRRHLLSARTLSHRGRALRWGRGVMKDVAGYDMRAAWSGARGRLGALTAATFRVWALPAERRVYRFRTGVAAAVALAHEPPPGAVRPDGVRWDWSGETGDRLEGWLLGSDAAVEERTDALSGWAARRGLAEPEVEIGPAPRALGAGGAVSGRARHPAEAVLRFRTAADGLAPLADALREAAGHAGVAVEILPASGVLWLGYRRGESVGRSGAAGSSAERVERLLDAARRVAPDVAVAVERGGPEEHAAVARRRPGASRSVEESVLDALHGRSRHWMADYL